MTSGRAVRLREKAAEYRLNQAAAQERNELFGAIEERLAPLVFAITALVLYEVAEALEDDDEL